MKYMMAVRYCGGCRVGYDRAARVNEILEGLRARGLDVVLEYDEPAPVALLVCGCMAQCLLRDEILPPAWHYVGPEGYFDGSPSTLEAVVSLLHNELAGPPDSR